MVIRQKIEVKCQKYSAFLFTLKSLREHQQTTCNSGTFGLHGNVRYLACVSSVVE